MESLKDKLDRLEEKISSGEINIKKKKIKIPRKAKVRRGKRKKGWIGILRIDENGNMSGEKVKIEDSTYKLKGGTYHATDGQQNADGQEILWFDGKYPIMVQEVKSKNPYLFNSQTNQTYGQKYIMARMLKDTIKMKKQMGNILIWILVIGAIAFGINYFVGG